MSLSDLNLPLPPLVEEAPDLGALRAQPLRFLLDSASRYGSLFRYMAGGTSTVVVNHPHHAQHVLQGHARNYVKQGTPDLMMLLPMLGQGLMTTEGEAWAEQRRVARPAFEHSRIEPWVQVMAECTEDMLRRWEDPARTGVPFDVERELGHLTLRIITRCLFGCDWEDATTDFAGAVQRLNSFMSRYDPGDAVGLRQFREASQLIDTLVQRILSLRRATGGGSDLLALLLDPHPRQLQGPAGERVLREQIFTFLMAGHETTAKALTWSLHLLGLHPKVALRVHEEARALLGQGPVLAQRVRALEFSGQVLQEAMRLYPPVWLMSRVCREDDCVGGYHLPAGTLVIVSPYLLHRHPDYWSEPETFDPGRFRDHRASARHPYAYLPFSGGPRVCIGRNFAMMEARLVLAMVLQRFQLQHVEGHRVEPEALVTLRPSGGLPMRARHWDAG